MKFEVHKLPKIKIITLIALLDNFTNVLKSNPKMINGNKNSTTDFIDRLNAYMICLTTIGITGFNKLESMIININIMGNFFNMISSKFSKYKIVNNENADLLTAL